MPWLLKRYVQIKLAVSICSKVFIMVLWMEMERLIWANIHRLQCVYPRIDEGWVSFLRLGVIYLNGEHDLQVKYGLLSIRIICLRCGKQWCPRGLEVTYALLSMAMTVLVSTYISNCWSIPILEDLHTIMGNISSVFLVPVAFPIMVIVNFLHYTLVKHTNTLEWWICSPQATDYECKQDK